MAAWAKNNASFCINVGRTWGGLRVEQLRDGINTVRWQAQSIQLTMDWMLLKRPVEVIAGFARRRDEPRIVVALIGYRLH